MITNIELCGLMSMRSIKIRDLAGATGIPATSLWRKLRGQSEFKVSELEKVCDYLGISITDSLELVSR